MAALGPSRQRGMVATFVAIIVLVATLIAATALVISRETSNTIAGNQTFRQELIQESERAYADATAKISFDTPTTYVDVPALGYYAEIQPHTVRPDIPDVLSSSPPSAGVAMPQVAPTNNTVTYVVERLCTAAPSTPAAALANCIVPGAGVTGGSASNQTSDSNTSLLPLPPIAYRVTVRVDGPRNSVDFMQTVLR